MRNLLRLNLRALHVGTAQLRMHAWLRGLRSTIGNTNARCVLDETAKIYLVANSAGEGVEAGLGDTAAAATRLVHVLPSCMPGCQVHPCMPPPSLRPPHAPAHHCPCRR